MNIFLFIKIVRETFRYFLYFLLIFFLSRLVFLISYGKDLISENKIDILKAFYVGLKFDVSLICYGFLPLVIFWLISFFIKEKLEDKFLLRYFKISKYYLIFTLFVFVFFQIIDFFFYQFFKSRINVLFFGIFTDDTKAVLGSVWKDYPIFKIILLFGLIFFSFIFIHQKISKNTKIKKNYWVLKFAIFLIFPLYFLALRGSVGVFPLRREHTDICTVPFINSLCYNGLYALKFAKTELDENQINPNVELEIQSSGFLSKKEIQEFFYQNSVDSVSEELWAKTPKNLFLEQNKPNVVFILMESMSNHYFELHSKQTNLLGDLVYQIDDLYYFKNGISSHNLTIETLQNILVNAPKGIISQSPYLNVSFKSSVAKPFKENGYQTSYVTGAFSSWRNVDNFIKNQYFENIFSSADIQKKYPNAIKFAWGTHDEYMFDFLEDFLKKNTHQPQFVFSLTVSNHTPYDIVEHYKASPIVISDSLKKEIRIEEKRAFDNFYSFQYSVSCLGRFIENIKKSPLGENTIIVVTGDHNVRELFEYSGENLFLKYSVPILFYIPEKYKPDFFDPNIMVSHKDIFPTIFNLSLSDQRYIYSGDNMFKKSEKYRFAVNGHNFIADNQGVLVKSGGNSSYYIWKDRNFRKLKAENFNEKAEFMLKKLNSFLALQNISIYEDINSREK